MPRKTPETEEIVGTLRFPIFSRPVIRKSDGRVFSCARGAALNYDNDFGLDRQIIYCCYGFIPKDRNGESWDFSDSKNPVQTRESVKQKRTDRYYPELRYKAKSTARQKHLRELAPIIAEWVETLEDPERYRESKEVYDDLVYFCQDTTEYNFDWPFRNFVRHLRAWEKFYQDYIGMKLSFSNRPRTNRSVVSVAFFKELITGNVDLQEKELYMYTPEHFKDDMRVNIPGPHGTPVKYEEAGVTFASLREASKAVGIHPMIIKICCEGDVPELRRGETVYHFSYGRLEDVKDLRVYHFRGFETKPVICDTNGQTYESIHKAEAATRVARSLIRKSCITGKEVPNQDREYFRFRFQNAEDALDVDVDFDDISMG